MYGFTTFLANLNDWIATLVTVLGASGVVSSLVFYVKSKDKKKTRFVFAITIFLSSVCLFSMFVKANLVIVPDLYGKNCKYASTVIERLGNPYEFANTPEDADTDTVIYQFPSAGETVWRNTRIILGTKKQAQSSTN